MVALVALLPFSDADAGCEGDCMLCHQNLADSKEHQVLKTCIQCHEPVEKNEIFPTVSADGCGSRCFECHDQWPADSWHVELDTCSKCHTTSVNLLKR